MGGCAGFEAEGPDSAAAMEHAYKFVLRWGSVLAVVLIIVWPLLALAAGTFSRSYFYFWVILSIIWGLVRAAAGVLPWELLRRSFRDDMLSKPCCAAGHPCSLSSTMSSRFTKLLTGLLWLSIALATA